MKESNKYFCDIGHTKLFIIEINNRIYLNVKGLKVLHECQNS
jgi:hypothetical protein